MCGELGERYLLSFDSVRLREEVSSEGHAREGKAASVLANKQTEGIRSASWIFERYLMLDVGTVGAVPQETLGRARLRRRSPAVREPVFQLQRLESIRER